jgi:MHS family proline/betaine transporter-like MFS transporter
MLSVPLDIMNNMQLAVTSNSPMAGRYRALVASTIGTMMEWYDFVVFAYLAPYISHSFFPSGDEIASLLATFATFGVGFLARPLGGFLFGALGDKRGRKTSMMVTMLLMAIATSAIGILPTAQGIGGLASILLVSARLLQGLSAGGERTTGMVYAVEWAPQNKRGWYGSLNSAGSGFGLILGSATVSILTWALNEKDVLEWGWRLPFLLGAIVGPIGIWIRTSINESPVYLESQLHTNEPRRSATRNAPWRLGLRIFFLDSFWSVAYYIFLTYMPTFSQKYIHIKSGQAFLMNTASLFVYMAATPIFGWLSDRIGRRGLMIGSCLCFAIFTYPLFYFLINGVNLIAYMAIIFSFTLMLAVFSGPAVAMFIEQFPTRDRNTWFGIGYSLSTAVFGGFTPYAATWLIRELKSPLAPTFYVIASALLCAYLVSRVKETAYTALEP